MAGTLVEVVRDATNERLAGTTSGPARFALQCRGNQVPQEVAAALARELAQLHPTVAPLSDLEPSILVIEFTDRTLDGVEPAKAFAAAYELAATFEVELAEPDLPTALFGVQPRFGEEGFDVPGCWVDSEPLEPGWALDRLRVPQAWALSEARQRPVGGAGIVVAQPDTGVRDHEELAGRAVVGGFDTIDDDADPTDPLTGMNPGHGTATASVAVSPKTLVLTGSAPNATHMPIRAIESVIRISQVTVARAIDWAVANGAHVITMSLGGIPSFSLHRALRRAVQADVLVLAAAGNCVRTVVWPARYSECIAVAGVNAADGMWRGTCRGAAVDISAPGQNVFRATLPSGTGQGQGTSFAVALTAGVAALWLAQHGRANLVAAARDRGETLQAMFLRLVRATARRPESWDPFEMGAGIVDAAALLAADLDLGRGTESVPPPQLARDSARQSVQSLLAETVGPHAAVDDSFDWQRYGPELALLTVERARPRGLQEDVAHAPEPSRELTDSISNPGLLTWLGVADGVPE